MGFTGREMRSHISEEGVLTLSLESVSIADPAADEIVVRVEAAPINPSDLGLLLGPADIGSLAVSGSKDHPALTFDVPKGRLAAVGGRLGQSLPIGNEAAGTVVAAGSDMKALEGKRVGMIGGAMFADYRTARAKEVIPLPDGTSAADGASLFVNPLTALGFVETARSEGHKAIVHTAAASNLGQMLQKVCLADGVPLVNVVRSQAQVAILREIGATYVLNSSDDDFADQLFAALKETGATIAFDPIGGGKLGSQIVQTMERVAVSAMSDYNRYGSDTHKQLYIYGALDPAPTVLNRLAFGFHWSVGGWLLFPFIQKAGPETIARLQKRIVAELTTTFASKYTSVIGLAEALKPEVLLAYEKKATGEKYLIDPTIG